MADIWFQIKFLQFLEWFRRSEFILGPNVGDCTSEVRRFCFNAKVENVRVVKWKKDHLAQTAAADHTKQKQNEEKKKPFFGNSKIEMFKWRKYRNSNKASTYRSLLQFWCISMLFFRAFYLFSCFVKFSACVLYILHSVCVYKWKTAKSKKQKRH